MLSRQISVQWSCQTSSEQVNNEVKRECTSRCLLTYLINQPTTLTNKQFTPQQIKRQERNLPEYNATIASMA